jgi:hypothetical protein
MGSNCPLLWWDKPWKFWVLWWWLPGKCTKRRRFESGAGIRTADPYYKRPLDHEAGPNMLEFFIGVFLNYHILRKVCNKGGSMAELLVCLPLVQRTVGSNLSIGKENNCLFTNSVLQTCLSLFNLYLWCIYDAQKAYHWIKYSVCISCFKKLIIFILVY